MSSAALGGSAWTPSHRAGLFPLPQLQTLRQSPINASRSARVRTRQQLRRSISAVTNRCVDALNQLYSNTSPPETTPLYSSSSSFSSFPSRSFHQSDKRTSVVSNSNSTFGTSIAAPPSHAQQRLLDNVQQRCAAFVSSVRAASSKTSTIASSCDVDPLAPSRSSLVLDALASFHSRPSLDRSFSVPFSSTTADDGQDPSWQTDLPQLLQQSGTSPFYSSHTTAVPLSAHRAALPSELNVVPLLNVLPPHLAQQYSNSSSLLRSAEDILLLDATDPLSAPRIAGSRAEYVALIGRMYPVGMLAFTDCPLAVNGVFCVEKDTDTDRVIIDARPANRLFVESPHVDLVNPSHLVQVQIPSGTPVHVGKSDLSNFYHHLAMPSWMQPFFCLPALLPEELRSIGLDPDTCGGKFPMCITLPMGFSHAVYLAQQAHLHVLYRSNAVRPNDNLLSRPSALLTVSEVTHGVVIDDFFLFALDPHLAHHTFERVLAAYAAAGFMVKPSKVVAPTTQPVKVIGFEVGGPQALVRLPSDSMLLLLQHTLAVLRRGKCTGLAMAHLVGRWTWCMLLQRPSLAAMQRVYRFIELAGRRRFSLWPSVRRELWLMLGLAPLLCARLDAEVHHRVIASDASQLAAGVVSAALTVGLQENMWPLCSSRRHATLQPLINPERGEGTSTVTHFSTMIDTDLPAPAKESDLALLAKVQETSTALYSCVRATRWSRVLSTPWRFKEHINVLELRAVALALHWLLSYPSAMGRRVYLLVDSAVALFSLLKGRSSAPSLLFVLRKISALLLASSVTLLSGWLPSGVNPADGASRLSLQLQQQPPIATAAPGLAIGG